MATLDEIVEAIGVEPYHREPAGVIYCADCLDVLPKIPEKSIDLVLTDPPYPNGVNHFRDSIQAAKNCCRSYSAKHWIVFWDEMADPPVPLPLVAKHIWHRTNTNRPDNYEAIYEFNENGIKKPSRVLPYAIICPGLTGCIEATGHPTQKNVKLMRHLLSLNTSDLILDPFLGSGTTAVAAKQLGRKFIGIEIKKKYCKIAVQRLAKEELF